MDLPDELFRRAKRRAADDGVTFRAVIEATLRRYLEDGGAPRRRYRLRWRTERGKLRPGVRLDDRGALFDLMDFVRRGKGPVGSGLAVRL